MAQSFSASGCRSHTGSSRPRSRFSTLTPELLVQAPAVTRQSHRLKPRPLPQPQRKGQEPVQPSAVKTAVWAERRARSVYLCRRFPSAAWGQKDPSGQGEGPGSLAAYQTRPAAEEAEEAEGEKTESNAASCSTEYIAPEARRQRARGSTGGAREAASRAESAVRLLGRRSPSRLAFRWVGQQASNWTPHPPSQTRPYIYLPRDFQLRRRISREISLLNCHRHLAITQSRLTWAEPSSCHLYRGKPVSQCLRQLQVSRSLISPACLVRVLRRQRDPKSPSGVL
ncbi:uncharacterized protein [Canis lupus baileyi]|uniref:uncharacterized protein n=1 Tax=Canis lupus baileyi TaxID=143281 RepID=UPI003B977728